jgi:hypothetical protein
VPTTVSPEAELSARRQPAAAEHVLALQALSILPAPSRPPVPAVRALAPERYEVQFTVGRKTHDKLRRAQDLLRYAIPNGDPAEIFDRALTVLLEQLERSKLAIARATGCGPGIAGSGGPAGREPKD